MFAATLAGDGAKFGLPPDCGTVKKFGLPPDAGTV